MGSHENFHLHGNDYCIVLYVPKTENGHMDDSKETTASTCGKLLHHIKELIWILSFILKLWDMLLAGYLKVKLHACMHVTYGVHGFTGMKAHHCIVYR